MEKNIELTNSKAKLYGSKQLWIMFISGFLLLMGTAIVGGSTNTVLPYVANAYGWNYPFLAMMAGAGIGAAIIGILFWGWVAQKTGPKLVIILAVVIGAIFLCVYASTKSLGLFVFSMMMMGFASGGYKETGALILTTNWFPRKKGVVLGFVTMGICLSDLVYQPFIPSAFKKFGFSQTMLTIAILFVVVAIVIGLFVKNTPEEMNTYPDGDSSAIQDLQATIEAMKNYKSPFTTAKMLKLKQTWQVGVGMGLFWMTAMCFVSQVVPSLMSLGYTFDFAKSVLMVAGISGLFGSFIFGVLDQKFGTKRAAQIYVIMIMIILPVCLFNGASPIIPWITAIIFVGSMGGVGNLIPSMIGTIFGRWDFAAANRIIYLIAIFFAGLGIFTGGLFSGTFGYNALWILCIGIQVISLIIISFIKTEMIGKKG